MIPLMTSTQALTNETNRAVAEMLVANTGTHMLDSGGDSGRAWQQNQQRVGDNDPVAYYEDSPVAWWGWPSVRPHPNFREGKDPLEQRAELWPVVSVYHFLTNMVTFNADMNAAYEAFCVADDEGKDRFERRSHLAIMEDFPEHWARLKAAQMLKDHKEMCDDDCEQTVDDFYEAPYNPFGGRGDHGFICDYSYNHDNVLSQDIQYVVWNHDGETFGLIQIHGGADARSGLTAPKAFDCFEGEFLDYNSAACGCDNPNCGASWYSAHGANWENDELPSLADIPAIEGDKVDAAFRCRNLAGDDDMRLVIVEGPDYAPSNTVMCPICGLGALTPYAFNF